MAGKRADRDRCIGRAERRGADRAEVTPGDASEDGRAVGMGGLALVSRHAERGVALQMFRDAETLAHREFDVGNGNVILEIDEGLASALGNLPDRACQFGLLWLCAMHLGLRSKTAGHSGLCTGCFSIGKA